MSAAEQQYITTHQPVPPPPNGSPPLHPPPHLVSASRFVAARGVVSEGVSMALPHYSPNWGHVDPVRTMSGDFLLVASAGAGEARCAELDGADPLVDNDSAQDTAMEHTTRAFEPQRTYSSGQPLRSKASFHRPPAPPASPPAAHLKGADIGQRQRFVRQKPHARL